MGLFKRVLSIPGAKTLWERFPVGSVDLRMAWGIARDYPYYAYGTYLGATLAKRLAIPRISVIEFGVAGGRGLVALEKHSREIAKATGVGIDVVGFDTGTGMPPGHDYRDLVHVWTEGFFLMDETRLRSSLHDARLILGDVRESVVRWLDERPAPVGFCAFDLDYYSSTMAAFQLFEAPAERLLPRVCCYFDDITGPDFAAMNDFVGELAAINDFNSSHATRKICQIRNLWYGRKRPENWNELIYSFHDFEHPLYTKNIMPNKPGHQQLPL